MTEQMERERMVLGGMMVDGYDMRDVIRELDLAGGPHGIAEIAGAYVGYELRR